MRPRITGKSEHMEEEALDILKVGLGMAMTLDKAITPKTKEEWTHTCEAMLIDRPLPNTERETKERRWYTQSKKR